VRWGEVRDFFDDVITQLRAPSGDAAENPDDRPGQDATPPA
jgi:hypothetical protein